MANSTSTEIIACHECDHLHYHEPIPIGAKANCRYCGNLLYRHVSNSLERSLALYITALMLFILANCFPFLSLELGGRAVDTLLFSSGWAMYQLGMGELGLLIFITSILFPLIVIVGRLYLLIFVRFGTFPPYAGIISRTIEALLPWSLVGVFMLGVLISIVKLQDLANVIYGPALLALALLLPVYTAARTSFSHAEFWSQSPVSMHELKQDETEPENRYTCHSCGFIQAKSDSVQRCPRCEASLHHRKQNSIEKTWALVIAASVLLIPANVLPVMTVIRFGQGEPSTILSGVMKLIAAGMWGLALIVFIASIVVPLMKLIILIFLLITLHSKSVWRPRDRTLLYRVTEVVGAWSMVDIYLVGVLSALVSLDRLSTIRPEMGAVFFAAVVVITMFAAQSFDPRLIWDNVRNKKQT